jgi:hypothetical protein
MTDKLILAASIALMAIVLAAINAPPTIGKADQIIPMNHVPAEASACNVG